MMPKMKIRAGILVTMAAAALTSVGVTLGAGAGQSARPEPPPLVADAEQAGKYIVRAHNGKIALFTDDFTLTPAIETDIDISGLRAYDRRLLENGIVVSTYEDVLRLLEDFGS